MTELRDQEHRYQIYELEDGIEVVPIEKNRPSVTYFLNKDGFWKRHKNNIEYRDDFYGIPLYALYYLISSIVEELYSSWTPPKRSKNYVKDMIVTDYCKTSTRKSISKIVRDIWKKKMSLLDPEIETLHRKLWSTSNGAGQWGTIANIIQRKNDFEYLIKDMINYNAARIDILHSGKFQPRSDIKWINAYEYEEKVITWEDLVDYDWKKSYSNTGEVYSELAKTLMNLPGGVPFNLLIRLENIRLPEPARTRMKLFAYSYLAKKYMPYGREREEFLPVIERSSEENIRNAIRYMWSYYPSPNTGDFRRTNGIKYALEMIFDYEGEIGNWTMLGLAKRSKTYHHKLEAEATERRMRWEEENKKLLEYKTAFPPIPLPEKEGVIFLDTYKEIVREGELMGHCLAQYASPAVKGGCYLFHVDYNGEMASVEVSPQGYVNQSHGPGNSSNKAATYAKRVLGKWSKKLEGKPPKIRQEGIEGQELTPIYMDEELPF